MINKYQIYLVSDSTGETLDRIFTAIKAQFENFNYYSQQFSFTRTQNQIDNILEDAKKNKDSVILYTIVDNKLSNFFAYAIFILLCQLSHLKHLLKKR